MMPDTPTDAEIAYDLDAIQTIIRRLELIDGGFGTDVLQDGERAIIVGNYTIERLRLGETVKANGITLLPADDLCAAPDINTPEIEDFIIGALTEAQHQRARWGESHDRSKSAENWYWLVGYLAGKALRASIQGDR